MSFDRLSQFPSTVYAVTLSYGTGVASIIVSLALEYAGRPLSEGTRSFIQAIVGMLLGGGLLQFAVKRKTYRPEAGAPESGGAGQ